MHPRVNPELAIQMTITGHTHPKDVYDSEGVCCSRNRGPSQGARQLFFFGESTPSHWNLASYVYNIKYVWWKMVIDRFGNRVCKHLTGSVGLKLSPTPDQDGGLWAVTTFPHPPS